ncbi:MAG: HU family DNA-binding protein [Bryobacteraceae bacterium]
MKKTDLARRLARQTHKSKAEAADDLDRVVHRILSNLRKGQPAQLPGLGRFQPGKKWSFEFEPGESDSPDGKK